MILPNELQNDYKKLGHGCLKDIMKALGFKGGHSHASNIMTGKASTTVSNVAKIKKFVDKRKALIAELTENDQN